MATRGYGRFDNVPETNLNDDLDAERSSGQVNVAAEGADQTLDAVEEVHHDLTYQGTGSNDVDESEDEGLDAQPPSHGANIIARLRKRDAKFQRLQQGDAHEKPEGEDNEVYDTIIPQSSLSQDERSWIASPGQVASPLGSFDEFENDPLGLDDTALDLEYGISRYAVAVNGSTLDPENGPFPGGGKRSRSRKAPRLRKISMRWLIDPVFDVGDRIKSARAEARRRRAEQLLSEEGLTGRFHLTWLGQCFSNWCDMTISNQGVIVFVACVMLFVLSYRSLDEEEDAEVRQWLLLVGVPSFVIRFMWRSVWWFCWEKRLERKRQARVLVFDGLNDGQAGGNEIAPSTTIDDDERSFLTLSRPGSMDDDISSRSLT